MRGEDVSTSVLDEGWGVRGVLDVTMGSSPPPPPPPPPPPAFMLLSAGVF